MTEIEARYQETDKMGVIYHGNYATWFEVHEQITSESWVLVMQIWKKRASFLQL